MGAVGLQQRGGRLHRLQQLGVGLRRGAGARRGGAGQRRGRGRRRVRLGDDGLVDLEVAGHRLVELVLALQQLLDPPQERSGLGSLDDPVVVGRGGRHHLAHAQRLDLVRRGVRPLDRVGERAAGDDRPLAAHQPRHRGDRADAARVGEADVGALEVVRGQLVLAGLGDQLLVVGVEAREVEPVRALDAGDHQAALALALDVDRDAEVDRGRLDDVRLAVDLLVVAGHHRPLLGGLDDRPGDQVGEADLHPALLEHAVQRLALGVEGVDREGAERGRRRDRAALLHRLGQHRRGPAQGLGLAVERGGAAAAPCRRRGREHVGLGHLAAGAGALDRAEADPVRGWRSASRRGWPSRRRRRRSRGPRVPHRVLIRRSAARSPRTAAAPAAHPPRHPRPPSPSRPGACPTSIVSSGPTRMLGDRAAGGGGDLGVDLVGRDLDDRVAPPRPCRPRPRATRAPFPR